MGLPCGAHGTRCWLPTAVLVKTLPVLSLPRGLVLRNRGPVGVEPEVCGRSWLTQPNRAGSSCAIGGCVSPCRALTVNGWCQCLIRQSPGACPRHRATSPLGWSAGLDNPRHHPQTRVPQVFLFVPVQCRCTLVLLEAVHPSYMPLLHLTVCQAECVRGMSPSHAGRQRCTGRMFVKSNAAPLGAFW
jgi:hypothetical protein